MTASRWSFEIWFNDPDLIFAPNGATEALLGAKLAV
jgi:hypothetical protein